MAEIYESFCIIVPGLAGLPIRVRVTDMMDQPASPSTSAMRSKCPLIETLRVLSYSCFAIDLDIQVQDVNAFSQRVHEKD